MTLRFVAAIFALSAGVQESGSWERFHREDGITLWRRDTPGSSFVTFRGRGPVGAPIDHVVAVLRDSGRDTEWMADCADAATIRYLSITDSIVYHRTASPVPFISDRDTVLKIVTSVDVAKKTVLIKFSRTQDPLRPPVDGVIRMPRVQGHWRLVALGPEKTEVEYQVQADPGGSLPAWLVNLVSKKLPYRTLQGLRRQVMASGYEHHRSMVRLAVDWAPFGVETATTAAVTSER